MEGYGPVDSHHDPSSLEADPTAAAGADEPSVALAQADRPADDDPSPATDGEPTDGEPTDGGARPRRWRLRHTLLAIVVVIVAAAAIAWSIQLPYYALTPGAAPDVAGMIEIQRGPQYHHVGSVHMVYVEETRVRALEWPFFKLDPDAAIIPAGAILGVETPAQYAVQGTIDMATAQQAAEVVALRSLGYHVVVTPIGALIYGVLPNSPAAEVLKVGDVVDGVDGKKVRSYLQFQAALRGRAPGTLVHLHAFTYPAGAGRTVSVRLGEFRLAGEKGSQQLACYPVGQGTKWPPAKFQTTKGGPTHVASCLGVFPQGSGPPSIDGTAFRVGPHPVKVDLSSEGVVGPSAGLAFTLGLMQELDPANLTGGRKIAASGTMSINGAVGDVGGVAQKTVAVRDEGASIFFVPPQELKVAESKAGPNLHVYAVHSIDQALKILESLGGKVQRVAGH